MLDDSFGGVLVSDFYAAFYHYLGLKQRCWAHLLRDIQELKLLYAEDTDLAQWAEDVHQLYAEAKGSVASQAGHARRNFLVPLPRVASTEDLDSLLQKRCRTT